MENDVIRLEGREEFTGRYLVVLNEAAPEESVRALQQSVGSRVARYSEVGDAAGVLSVLNEGDGVVFDSLGIAVVNADSTALASLSVSVMDASNPVETVTPERYVYALDQLDDYLRGYNDGTSQLIESLRSIPPASQQEAIAAAFSEANATWGLQITRSDVSRYSGKGIKLAVLDTGLDLNHPDFAGRTIKSQSFLNGVPTAQDGHGHGTHCIGTACGPKTPRTLPRYGVAYDTQIYAGKVLSDAGSGPQASILAGIEWAIREGCEIISMSLGSAAVPGSGPDPAYERAGQVALSRGTLIIAAAGNDSRRPMQIMPVGYPANSPSIMAVAAVDANLRVASFSNGGLNPFGGAVDIAAPGVDVYSSVPGGYARMMGTSMATPHVAGVAALYAEATGLKGAALWTRLMQMARRLSLPSYDVGMGLVQAP